MLFNKKFKNWNHVFFLILILNGPSLMLDSEGTICLIYSVHLSSSGDKQCIYSNKFKHLKNLYSVWLEGKFDSHLTLHQWVNSTNVFYFSYKRATIVYIHFQVIKHWNIRKHMNEYHKKATFKTYYKNIILYKKLTEEVCSGLGLFALRCTLFSRRGLLWFPIHWNKEDLVIF